MELTTQAAWNQFSDRLRQFIGPRLPVNAGVEDVLQEVFLRIHRELPKLRNQERLEAWVYRITRITISDFYRERYKADLPELLEEDLKDDSWEGLQGCLSQMVHQLPEPYREALSLVELQGQPQTKTARELGISYSGLKSRVQRGRLALRNMIVGCCEISVDQSGNLRGDYNPEECGGCGN